MLDPIGDPSYVALWVGMRYGYAIVGYSIMPIMLPSVGMLVGEGGSSYDIIDDVCGVRASVSAGVVEK